MEIDISKLGHQYKYWVKTLNHFDWKEIQKLHNEGKSLNDIYKIFNICRSIIDMAEKIGLFIKIDRPYTHTNERKELISKRRKDYLTKNPDKHPWKDPNKSKSFPCEFLKQKLLEKNIRFEYEYSPLVDRHFSIDIAFVDKKIGIEINGNFHYEQSGELKEYYKKRHDLITNAGWTIYEIRYNHAFGDKIVNDIISDITQLDSDFYKKYIRKPDQINKETFMMENNIDTKTEPILKKEPIVKVKKEPVVKVKKEPIIKVKKEPIIKEPDVK